MMRRQLLPVRHMDVARRQLAEFQMKACSDCCFSNGGHLFAAASNNSIAVYNTYTCELTGTLRYASSNVLSFYYQTQDNVHSSSRTHAQANDALLLAGAPIICMHVLACQMKCTVQGPQWQGEELEVVRQRCAPGQLRHGGRGV